MSITYRGNKFRALTHEELDENFRDLRYDTDLDRVTNVGNTTNVSITVESITANTITTTNTIIQELSLLATDELTFAEIDPNYLQKSVEIGEGVRIVGQEGSIYAPGNIIQVKQRIFDKPSRYYFQLTSSTYSSDFLGWDKSKGDIASEVFNDGVLSFTPYSTDSNNTVQVNLCLNYSMDSKQTSETAEVAIELWDYPIDVFGTYKFITNLATIKSGTISTDPNNVCGNTLQSLNLVYFDENISNTRNYVIRFARNNSITSFLNINQTNQMYYASNTFVETSNVAVTTRTWEPYVESIVDDDELITNFNDGNNQLDVANTESTTWAFERGTANTQRFGPNNYTPDFGEYVINGHPGTKFDVIMYDDFNEPTINTIKWNSSSTINLVSANTGVSATGNTEGLRVPDIKATNEIVLSVNDYSDGQNLISQSSTDWDIANCNSEIFVCQLDDVNLAFSKKLYPPSGKTNDPTTPAGYNVEQECLAYVNNRWTFPKNPKSSNNAIVFPGGWNDRLNRKIELYSKFLDLTNYTHISFYMIRGNAGNGYYRSSFSGGSTPYMQLDFRNQTKNWVATAEPFGTTTSIRTEDTNSTSNLSDVYKLRYLNQNSMFEWEKYHLEIPAAARLNNMRIHFAFYYNDSWFAIQDLTVYNEVNLDSSSCYYLKTDENNYGTCVLESNDIDLSNTYGLTYYFAYGTDTNGGLELNNKGCNVINSETIYDDFETGTLNSSLWDTANSEGFTVSSSGTGTGTGGFISPYGNYYLNSTASGTGRFYRILISKPLDLTNYTHFGYTTIKGNNANGGASSGVGYHYTTLRDVKPNGDYKVSYNYVNFNNVPRCSTSSATPNNIDDFLFKQPINDESEYDGNITTTSTTTVWSKSLYLIPESWRKNDVVLIIEIYQGSTSTTDGQHAFDNIFFTNDVTPSANIQIEIVNDNGTWNSSNINLSTWHPFYSNFVEANPNGNGTNPDYVLPKLRQTPYNWTQERIYIPPNYRKENSKLKIKVHNATGDIGFKDLRFYQFEKNNSNYYLPFYNENVSYYNGTYGYVVAIPKILTQPFLSPNLAKIKFDVFTGGLGGRQAGQLDHYSYERRSFGNASRIDYEYSQWKTTPNYPPMDNWFYSHDSNGIISDERMNYYNGLSPCDTDSFDDAADNYIRLNVKIHYSETGLENDWLVYDAGSKDIVTVENVSGYYHGNYKRLASSLGQQIEIEINDGNVVASKYKKLEMWITFDGGAASIPEEKRITRLSEGDPTSQTDPIIADKFLPRATVAITKVVGFDANIENLPIDITEYVVEGYTVFNDTNQSNPQSSLTVFEIVKD